VSYSACKPEEGNFLLATYRSVTVRASQRRETSYWLPTGELQCLQKEDNLLLAT
jgi:hypothetical protein